VGSKHTCVLLEDDRVVCWGLNPMGQVGSGQFSEAVPLPVEVFFEAGPKPRKAVSVVAGTFHTCALFDDNALYCWGENQHGALGLSHTNNVASPQRALLTRGLGDLQIKQVDGGFNFTCLLSTSGEVHCMGEGYCPGGDPTRAPMLCGPVQVMGPSLGPGLVARQIATGCAHSCAITDHGDMYCWGNGESGALGGGQTK